MFFRSFLLISLALFCHLSISEFGSVTAEVDEDEVQELKRQLMKEDATKSKQVRSSWIFVLFDFGWLKNVSASGLVCPLLIETKIS